MPRRLILNISLAVVSIVIAAAAAEVGARVWLKQRSADLVRRLEQSRALLPAPASGLSLMGLIQASAIPGLYYELKPRLETTFQGVAVRTNSLGMRGPEVAPPGASCERRFLGLGDSVTFGWGVREEDTFIARAAALLGERTPGRQIVAYNAGVPGYNAAQEVALYDARGAALPHDVVVIAYTGNDMLPPQFMPVVNADGTFNGRHSAFLALLSGNLDRFLAGLEFNPFSADAFSVGASMRPVLEAYRRLGDLARARGAGAIVVHGKYGLRADETDDAPWKVQRGVLRRFAEDEGFTFVDQSALFLDEMKRRGWESSLMLCLSATDGHPNAAGHAIIARAVADAIEKALPLALDCPKRKK